jgi:ribulose kinase
MRAVCNVAERAGVDAQQIEACGVDAARVAVVGAEDAAWRTRA